MKEDYSEKLKKVLIKKAMGYEVSEQVCEYTISEDGEAKLSKKKVTKKQVLPDLAAMKMLMESEITPVSLSELSDEQLQKERQRLEKLISEEEDANREMQQTDEV